MQRKFGWTPKFDERSKGYSISAILPTRKRRSYTWRCLQWLDQGATSGCTGFAVSHEMIARPAEVKGITNQTAQNLYEQAQVLDQWPGEDYEGSSVLGAMKAAVIQGYYVEYRWAFNENDIAASVGYFGPVVMGTNWYSDMMSPDTNGIIRPMGPLVGGHAYLICGYSKKTGLYRIRNSWGKSWGIDGDCFIEAEDVAYLMSQDAEACIPVVRCE